MIVHVAVGACFATVCNGRGVLVVDEAKALLLLHRIL